MKTKKNVKNVVKYTVLIIWTFVSLFPLYYMLMFSLKDNSEIFGSNVIGLPKHWLWSNYKKALIAGNMGLYFFNSCVVTGLTILFTILFSLMAAYALERMIWKGRKQINALFMLGLTVPIHAAILPIFYYTEKVSYAQQLSEPDCALCCICSCHGNYDMLFFYDQYSC